MQQQDAVCERNQAGVLLEQMHHALHELCQPLTTLQCRLEIAGLLGTAEAYREAVDLGLVECGRLVEGVHAMREILQASRNAEHEATGCGG